MVSGQLSTGDAVVTVCSAERMAVVGDGLLIILTASQTRVVGIHVHNKWALQVWIGQHRDLNQCRLKPFKGCGTVLGEMECTAFLCELVQGACNGSRVLDEPPVIQCLAKEAPQLCNVARTGPVPQCDHL